MSPDKIKLENFLEKYDSLKVLDLICVMSKFKNKPIFIYGAGSYGTLIYNIFSKYNIKVSAFLDIKAQPGDKLFNIPVYRANDKLNVKKEEIVVIVAIVKDYKVRQEIFNFIKKSGFKKIIDAQSIRCYFVYFDNKMEEDLTSKYIEKEKENILKCFDLFLDEQSREIYCKNIIAHITREYDDCVESIGSLQYFPEDIPFNKGYKRFIDCGGYIGDTIEQLIKLKKEAKAAVIFEPNLNNFLKLSSSMDNCFSKIPELYLYPCAVSNETKITFMDYAGGSSVLSSKNKDNFVQCVSLDDALKGFSPSFIKMDVEGEEKNTIIGAKKIIKRFRPDLAICVYHCINHLWDIALLINSWKLGYKFYLRTHNSFTMETVLYATSNI